MENDMFWLSQKEQLQKLHKLDLSILLPGDLERLQEVPDWVGLLTGLVQLNLSGFKRLKALHPAMRMLVHLKELDVSNCASLLELPPWTTQLHSLQQMNLSGCLRLKDLPHGLGNWTNLNQLDLSGCLYIQRLSSEIGKLTSLQRLNLSRCLSLQWLHSEMTKLQRLQLLDLSECKLLQWGESRAESDLQHHKHLESEMGLPLWITQLVSLQHVNLSGCYWLKELPLGLDQLTCLQKFDLSSCSGLLGLPTELGRLTRLRHLNLSRCSSLQELPPELGKLQDLEELDVEGCSAMQTPPSNVRRQGTKAVVQYLLDLCEGKVPCYMLKLVLVGDQCSGKSSLCDSLRAETTKLRANKDRTVGIDIRRWMPSAESPIVARVFDLAGHQVYQATHKVFMSQDCLYVDVLRWDQGIEAAISSIFAWMELAQSASPGCVMVVALSCVDMCDDAEHLETHINKRIEKLKQRVESQVLDVAAASTQELQRLEEIVEGEMQGDSLVEWQELRAKRDSTLRKRDSELVSRYQSPLHCKDSGLAAISQLEAFHTQMSKLEIQMELDAQSRLAEMRRLCTWRQTVIFCGGFSNATGYGLDDLRRGLLEIMSCRELFPNVGAKVPLNYMLLERCMQRETAYDDSDHDGYESGDSEPSLSDSSDVQEDGQHIRSIDKFHSKAEWERVCEKHHRQMALLHVEGLEELEKVCSEPVVRLSALKTAAGRCNISPDELRAAIGFLHMTGSLLYFGLPHSGLGRPRTAPTPRPTKPLVLSETIFSSPAWIIDAVSCFVHEPEPEDLDAVHREMLRVVEARFTEDFREYRSTGNLTDALLRGFWTAYRQAVSTKSSSAPGSGPEFGQHHTVLVQLLCALRLIRKVDSEEGDEPPSYVVPTMFPRKELPQELVQPLWLPSAARGADAFMRRQYSGAGHAPTGLLSELQTQWSCGTDDVEHFASSLSPLPPPPLPAAPGWIDPGGTILPPPPAPFFRGLDGGNASQALDVVSSADSSAALKERLATTLGSHLEAFYGPSGAEVEEHVVVSVSTEGHPLESGTDAIRSQLNVMAWAKLWKGSGTVTWQLFRRVTACIEASRGCPLVTTDKRVVWVPNDSAEGLQPVMAMLSTCRRAERDGKQWVKIKGRPAPLDLLLPIPRTLVAKRGGEEEEAVGLAVKRPCARASMDRPRILAFYAQVLDDSINVHREAQDLANISDLRNHFEIITHAQPLVEDVQTALCRARLDCVKIIHLAGHCDPVNGFRFLADRGSTAKSISPKLVVQLLAGTSVPIVVLNCCESEKLAIRSTGRSGHGVCEGILHNGAPCHEAASVL